MKSIEEQIEALTQELDLYPQRQDSISSSIPFYLFDGNFIIEDYFYFEGSVSTKYLYRSALFASTNKAEVEEYADCYKRLKLYQLLGKKAEKEFPLTREGEITLNKLHGTDFIGAVYPEGAVISRRRINRQCVLGGIWFSREEDRLEALKICGIDAEFQKKCAKHGLGGA